MELDELFYFFSLPCEFSDGYGSVNKLSLSLSWILDIGSLEKVIFTTNYTFTPLAVFIVPSIGMLPWKKKLNLVRK
jgi:hypothetical protein